MKRFITSQEQLEALASTNPGIDVEQFVIVEIAAAVLPQSKSAPAAGIRPFGAGLRSVDSQAVTVTRRAFAAHSPRAT